MPTGDQKRKPKPETEEEAPQAEATKTDTDVAEETDELLDEIDEVLEVNAEDFVKAFVQKGGQLVIPGMIAAGVLQQMT
jgi:ubiquitin-like protein Pup